MRRLVVVGLGCVGLGGVAWMVASAGAGEGSGVPERVTSAPSGVETTRGDVAPARSSLSDVVSAVPGASPAPSDAFVYRIRLVEGETRAPLPGAQARWFTHAELTDVEGNVRYTLTTDPEAWPSSVGQRGSADEQGRLTVRSEPSYIQLVARHGPLYGQTILGASTPPEPSGSPFAGEIVVALYRDATLRVRTVDPWDNVVPGTVVVVRLIRTVDGAEHRVQNYELPGTDAEGIVTVPHAPLLVAHGPGVTAFLRARLFPGDGERVGVELRAPPAQPVDVVVPAFGSVEVFVFGADGRPWTQGSAVEVASLEEGSARRASTRAPIDARGRALLDRVRCGARLRVSGPLLWNVSETVDGPLRHGDRVQVWLRLPEDAAHLTGRLLLGDGQPFAGTIEMQAQSQRGSLLDEFTTGVNGLFRVPIAYFEGDRPVLTVARKAVAPVQLEAELSLAKPLARGDNDVGDIVLAPTPLLVAGRVLDVHGAPAAGLRIEIEQRFPGESWHPMRWKPLTDDDGRFEAHSLPRGHEYRLRVLTNGTSAQAPPPLPFPPGTRNLLVRLDR